VRRLLGLCHVTRRRSGVGGGLAGGLLHEGGEPAGHVDLGLSAYPIPWCREGDFWKTIAGYCLILEFPIF